jgi:hypothetical protein
LSNISSPRLVYNVDNCSTDMPLARPAAMTAPVLVPPM